MDILYFLIEGVVAVFLTALLTAMFLRAILSWFIMDENKFTNFLYAVTEPFIYPVRRFLERMNWLQNSPIDFSFMITFLLLSFLSIFLGV